MKLAIQRARVISYWVRYLRRGREDKKTSLDALKGVFVLTGLKKATRNYE